MFKKTIYIVVMLGVICTSVYAQSPSITYFVSEADAVKVADGMFNTYRSDKSIYWEIPDSLINRTFGITTTLLTTPSSPDRDMEKKFGYSGDMIGPTFFGFKKEQNSIWITDPLNERYIENKKGDFAKIAAQRGDIRLYKELEILARDASSSLIDVTKLLRDFPLFTLDIVSFDLMIGSQTTDKYSVKSIKGYEDRVLINADRYYQNLSMQRQDKQYTPSYVGNWDTGICIQLLPKEPLEPLVTNSGSYFKISKEYFEGDKPAINRSFAKRWRLEITPEDKYIYEKGEKVQPIKPITFYIDRNTPPQYVNSIIDGVKSWNVAFDRAGFKDAIDARIAPDEKEDPNFLIYDSNYPFISWKISGSNNAYGPTPCDSRTGEIINCHIALFSSVLNLQQKWYFAQNGSNDPLSWGPILSDSLLNLFIKQTVSHEVGHVLGLEHNYMGSSHFNINQLRDNDFLSENGITSSIMDYVRFNYALRPEDKVDLNNRPASIGEYDKWAIEWAYRIFPGKNEEERNRSREAWNENKQKDRLNRFSGAGVDIRSQAEDLGNDHVAFNAQGIDNIKLLCENPKVWKITDMNSQYVYKGRYKSLIDHYKQWVQQVISHLGGITIEEVNQQQLYIPEETDYNRRVMSFIQEYVLNPPIWLFNQELTKMVKVDGKKEFETLYNNIISDLIKALHKIDQLELVSTNILSVGEYLHYMHDGLFSDWNEGEIVNEYKFHAQLLYITQLIKLLEDTEKTNSSNLLIKVMSELEQIKEDGFLYYNNIDNPIAKRQVAYLINKITI